jgi:hypothetical protein
VTSVRTSNDGINQGEGHKAIREAKAAYEAEQLNKNKNDKRANLNNPI